MSIQAQHTRLVALTKELSAQWEQTKESWRDAKCQEFEQRFMNELWASVNRALVRIQELEKTLAKVRDECA